MHEHDVFAAAVDQLAGIVTRVRRYHLRRGGVPKPNAPEPRAVAANLVWDLVGDNGERRVRARKMVQSFWALYVDLVDPGVRFPSTPLGMIVADTMRGVTGRHVG